MIRAVHKETNEAVAIKMVSKKDLDGHELKGLLTEIKISANVASR